MQNDKSLYRNLLNQLSAESGKAFYFFKTELAQSELGIMLTDASLVACDSILHRLKQPGCGYTYRMENKRYLPIVAKPENDDLSPFGKVAPVLVYVFDNFIKTNHLELQTFYAQACAFVAPEFTITSHIPWKNELEKTSYQHLNPSLLSESDSRILRHSI